jgi:hypothetical protein
MLSKGVRAADEASARALSVPAVGRLCLSILGGALEVLGLGLVALERWLEQRREVGGFGWGGVSRGPCAGRFCIHRPWR